MTHVDYMEEYGDSIEDLGTYYDNAKLTMAVPEYVDIDSIADLADNGLDAYDSGKQLAAAAVPQLYSVVNGHKVAINGIHGPVTQPTVPMGIRVQNSGEYTIDATNIDMMVSVFLEDITTGAFQDLNQQPTYVFSSEGGTFDDRFVLHFSAQVVGDGRDAINRVSTGTNPSHNGDAMNRVSTTDNR